MAYFSNFNKLIYRLADDDQNITQAEILTNILQRTVFLKEIINNVAISYSYPTKDSDKPEIISHKLYGSTNRHWVVLLFNDIQNPLFDFALDNNTLEKYIINKYDYANADIAKETLHHYEKRIKKDLYQYGTLQSTTTESFIINDKIIDYDTGEITTRVLPVDPETPLPVVEEDYDESFDDGTRVVATTTLNFVSVYEYEQSLNEGKRNIRLIDKSYIPLIEKQFKSLMQNA